MVSTDCSLDSYERGIGKLFDDRVEEWIVHDTSASALPRQRPDRILGLRETAKIRMLLDQSPRDLSYNDARKIRDLLQCSPFKWQPDPLLFPFLVLEAKADSAQDSFLDIRYQTAFPVKRLLDLQCDLQSRVTRLEQIPQPLVWFLGYRGSDWKIYGCYLSSGSPTKSVYVSSSYAGAGHGDVGFFLITRKQNIHHLQGGDIATIDGALQLLLVIDYLVDWARDTFRTSIIAQLLCLEGNDLDNITLGPDSDIRSKQKVTDWNDVSPLQGIDPSLTDPTGDEMDDVIFSKDLPNTTFGTVRSGCTARFQIAGLRITEDNVGSLLRVDTRTHGGLDYNACARKLINELTSWNDVLVVIGADLDYLERHWIGDERTCHDPFSEGPGTEYYLSLQYRCFMNDCWEIIRECSYIAISPGALDTLKARAAFRKMHKGIEAFPSKLRQCHGALFRDAIDCLRCGSMWQVLQLAIRSTLLSLTPEPARKRADTVPPVEYLGFSYTRSRHAGPFVDEIIRMSRSSARPLGLLLGNRRAKRRKTQSNRYDAASGGTFWRRFEKLKQLSTIQHVASECERCNKSGHDFFSCAYPSGEQAPLPTAYGAILVVSLRADFLSAWKYQDCYDVCLFVYDSSLQEWEELSFLSVVEDLAQDPFVHHTILHGPAIEFHSSSNIFWNLPLPYRTNAGKRQLAISRWIRELRGESPEPASTKGESDIHPWTHMQMLLHCLDNGMSYGDAMSAIDELRDEA